MNHRRRASAMSLHEVATNLAPWRPHVDASAGGLSPSSGSSAGSLVSGDVGAEPASPEASLQRQANRARCLDALHSYVIELCDYSHEQATPIFNRIVSALDAHVQHLDPSGQAGEAG